MNSPDTTFIFQALRFSPDEKKIVGQRYDKSISDSQTPVLTEIYMIDIETMTCQFVHSFETYDRSKTGLAWSPDGNKIIYNTIDNEDDISWIYIFDIGTSDVQKITEGIFPEWVFL